MAKFRQIFDNRPLVLGSALSVTLLSLAGPVTAQQVITDNSSIYSNNPNVYVDLSVLDQLGQPATLQSLLSGRQAIAGYPQLSLPSDKLKLKAPASAKPKVAKAKPKPKPIETISTEPEVRLGAAEPTPASPAPKVAVETTPVPPAPPAPTLAAPAAPTPIVKLAEAPKATTAAVPPAPPTPPAPPVIAPAPPPAPPAIEARPAAPMPPSAPEIKRPTELSSLPEASAPSVMEGGETLMQIVFADGATRIPDSNLVDLKALAGRMSKDDEMRLQLLAYAEGTDANASKARRLSLSRALSVRSYLIDQGVRSTRIDVRALGNKAGSGPSERVDVMLLRNR